MNKIIDRAVAHIATLPEADQERIGRDLLDHVSKLKSLRADIAGGLAELNAGKGRELDLEEIIGRARRQHEGG